VYRGRFEVKFAWAHNWEQMLQAYTRAEEAGIDVMLVEEIPGPDDRLCSYFTYLDEDSRPMFHFTKRIIRRFPVGQGNGCYHVTDWVPEARDLGLRLFRQVGLRGLANVEFKRDERDGQLKLIECNHRFTLANELVRRAGIDIPRLAYDRLVGREPPPVDAFREGVRMWHLVEDTRAFFDYRRAGELSATRWLVSLLHRQHFPLLDRDDPGPSLFELRRKGDALRRRFRP
jgi:predicted ATP-grasp superfamily ATP-dependent carboligase